jgi:hypothetical protein
MKTRTAACTVLLALTAALTACSSSSGTKADPAACKAAMTKLLRDGIAKGKDVPEGKKPAACKGIDDKTLERLGKEVLAKELPKAVESALPKAIESALATPTETSTITPECRAWIKKELLDSSDSIDATSGEAACGYLPKAELDTAIDTVTNELMKQSATPTP